MKCAVEKLAVYLAPPGLVNNKELKKLSDSLLEHAIELDVSWVKPIQRRRLSDFAKMVLSCAHSVNPDSEPMPIVFSSRHGDLHKTSDLLAQLVEKEPLSPTQFGLSVHNAVVGLLSILTKNTSPITALAAGANTFSAALCEAYIQLHSQGVDRVMVIHADRALPDLYKEFADEPQCDHCVAFVISHGDATHCSEITHLSQAHTSSSGMMQALVLAHAVFNKEIAHIDQWRVSHG
ncbi:beta-ketoacyl synthase chain length factor [Pseudoalteromonas sp. SSDWG2]|uniref:beta-ketoacyl synthase chain length factor n=1 Tax=Pseudoalteromonas sp. SSDWG2 TaxID=3139391 RepID=UPI003BAD1ECB